ncbi:MAG: outer membrane lipoprotein-sorting protein [Deltaproteobacteria bacterium]|nr:outer membrane lipoprotein-sorting protein [Deltaproteobacteria bacterium]
MKVRVLLSIVIVMFLCQSVFALTGREIMDKSDALPEPQTAVSSALMHIYKGSRILDKEFEIRAKKFKNDEDKILISFIRPTKIKLLTHSHTGQDDDQWLRLTSGKIKRIASSDKGKAFVNSHFYYEDLGSRNIDEYNYKLLGEGKAVGEDCYKVEAIKKEGTKVYDKLILYVRKSDYFAVRIDFYRKGKFHKYLENHEIKKVKDILTPFNTVMALANGKGKTELKIEKLEYNKKMTSSTFNKEALR